MADDRTYANAEVRIHELLTGWDRPLIEGLSFEHCWILGPALLLLTDCELEACDFGGLPDERDGGVLWVPAGGGTRVLGAIMVRQCIFRRCSFRGIGYTGNAETLEALREVLKSPG